MINTILVEDDLYIQKHFVDRLAADGEFHLVGVFRDAFEAEKHCNATVKLVLMDVQTQHKHSGLAAAERIKKAFPQIKIVVATSLVDPEVLQRAKLGAADSLWYKDSTQKRLMDVVRQTMAGEHIFPDAPPTVEIGMAKSTEFTKTELKVLRHLMRGLSYTRIAAEMSCEMSTVKFHVANMLQKTGLENKLQLALAVSDAKMIADLAEE